MYILIHELASYTLNWIFMNEYATWFSSRAFFARSLEVSDTTPINNNAIEPYNNFLRIYLLLKHIILYINLKYRTAD